MPSALALPPRAPPLTLYYWHKRDTFKCLRRGKSHSFQERYLKVGELLNLTLLKKH